MLMPSRRATPHDSAAYPSGLSERSTRYGANVVLGSIAFLAVLVLVNYLSARHSRRVLPVWRTYSSRKGRFPWGE